ncbi:MAG: DUF2281 domain-containing protein [Gemmatimonadetes bacterium]|nr:hypothetical protein [Gemmatimonadota bacterium]MYA10330.1 DUF2281 domain-containing protein [Gemmatimonadota bacterium]MYE69554.1 DUF2281 domain-containing protein [Gemmatimonadota bacterium]MYJ67643.1 DUF2281 domain-containing protein [Gemmatimonadota bacterium]
MHDVLRNRILRKLESLPEEQIYQVLDYIEFLESRHGQEGSDSRARGFQRLGEGIEDGLRKRAVNPSNLREAFQVIAAADKALSGVAKAGRKLFGELAEGVRGAPREDRPPDDRDSPADDEEPPPAAGRERSDG